ncbi:MAG: hypothetical protein AAGM67_06080, partial [Bacteroidota bacterium]
QKVINGKRKGSPRGSGRAFLRFAGDKGDFVLPLRGTLLAMTGACNSLLLDGHFLVRAQHFAPHQKKTFCEAAKKK